MAVDLKLELIFVPVSDVDASKAFYTDHMGFSLLVDVSPMPGLRIVQLDPPGSSCSITIGTGLTPAEPGTFTGMHLVVTDIIEARDELLGRGAPVGDLYCFTDEGRVPGVHPERGDYQSYAEIPDPDGNLWLLQEVGHHR